MLVSNRSAPGGTEPNFPWRSQVHFGSDKKETNPWQVKIRYIIAIMIHIFTLVYDTMHKNPPICFQYHHLLFVLCAVLEFPWIPPDSTTPSQKFRPKITGLLHLGYLGPCQTASLGFEADFSLQVMFVYFRQIAENQPQYALASYSTAAESTSQLCWLVMCAVCAPCGFIC